MVSPSKVQYQEQKQPPRKKNLEKRLHSYSSKNRKPLENKTFYLDIKNHAVSAKLESRIKELGGVIELFLVRNVKLVISDRVNKLRQSDLDKRNKWMCTSGGSGGPPSLRSTEVPTPTPTPPTPFLSSTECPLSNSTNLWGQTTQRSKSRVDAMLERALIQPQQCSVDPLDNAQSWGIPIWSIDKLQTWLDKIDNSLKDTSSLQYIKQTDHQQYCDKSVKFKHLKRPYIKFESFQRVTRPVFLELPVWPTLNFDGEPGSCPFDVKKADNVVVKREKEVPELSKPEENKEMTRRPRTTATRTRKTEQLVTGHCEICRVDYRDLKKHLQTDQHLNFVKNDDNFLSLDTLINSGTSVEAFLQLNRAKDIDKECGLFPNGNHSVHKVVLPESQSNHKAKSLNNYSDEEDLKMGLCNGRRRDLGLKLSSHNLRTRMKHESGHLLRSKGSIWPETEKTDKFYDNFQGYTITKRSKGTIWIEEDDPKEVEDKQNKNTSQTDEILSRLTEKLDTRNLQQDKKCSFDSDHGKKTRESSSDSVQKCREITGNGVNGLDTFDVDNQRTCKSELIDKKDSSEVLVNCTSDLITHNGDVCDDVESRTSCDLNDKDDQKNCKGFPTTEEVPRDDSKSKPCRPSRRGGRASRGRHRLSVEERLIEDNRAYYKVEVLGSKLRSSVPPNNNPTPTILNKSIECQQVEEEKKEEIALNEKPVVVRFKRVRKSELSLLSDEAESFMFGEPKRDEFCDTSDGDQSSILPKDTESDCNHSTIYSSPLSTSSSPVKQEIFEEDSQDSLVLGRARKRRRTQAEKLLEDNTGYYKFETPGSRLRYQAPITGIKDNNRSCVDIEKPADTEELVEKVYPSKPSAEVEKMQFSFESIPKSEPWYQTYQRQDQGAEFWHSFSEGDLRKPFLLPYEIDNFQELLIKYHQRMEQKKKGRGRYLDRLCRSPRKSPRCHASTLAIMSTIIKKKEQQQDNTPTDNVTVKDPTVQSSDTTNNAPLTRIDNKGSMKVEIDEELKSIDDLLNIKNQEEDSFETNLTIEEDEPVVVTRKGGAPSNLFELLNNYHEVNHCLDNSSCASSECGEGNVEFPLKKRKKRKNRTGWPGNKLKRKLNVNKHCPEVDKTKDDFLDNNLLTNNPQTSHDNEKSQMNILTDDDSRKNLDIGEISENDPGNSEKSYRKDLNSITERFNLKSTSSKQKTRINGSSDNCESENQVVYRKNNTSSEVSEKKTDSKTETVNVYRKTYREKRTNRNRSDEKTSNFDDENCKKDFNCPKKRATDTAQSDSQDTDCDCSLSERISPAMVSSSELKQRRSSIDFQPVVRMMKIEDQVDMDHNVLSVTVASNRRLRSSSSPRSSLQRPKKRLKTQGRFGRWLKNS